MAQTGALQRSIVEQDRLRALTRFDLGLISNGPNDGVMLGDLRIIEQVDIRARRRPDIHDIFEEQEFLPRERALGHAQPGIARQQLDDTDQAADAQPDEREADEPAPVSARLIGAKENQIDWIE